MEEITLKGYFILSCIYNLFWVPRVKCHLCSIILKWMYHVKVAKLEQSLNSGPN